MKDHRFASYRQSGLPAEMWFFPYTLNFYCCTVLVVLLFFKEYDEFFTGKISLFHNGMHDPNWQLIPSWHHNKELLTFSINPEKSSVTPFPLVGGIFKSNLSEPFY